MPFERVLGNVFVALFAKDVTFTVSPSFLGFDNTNVHVVGRAAAVLALNLFAVVAAQTEVATAFLLAHDSHALAAVGVGFSNLNPVV